MKIKQTHTVPAIAEKIRLQEYAVSVFISLPTKSSLKKALKKKLILLNGRPANTSDWIQEGQKLELLEAIDPIKKVYPLALEVIFEDQYLAVVHKPSGIPTSGNYFKTVTNALAFNLEESTAKDALPAPLPVHRLDNLTSGLLLIAKSKKVQVALNRLFEVKQIRKTYHALVFGTLCSPVLITHPIKEKKAETKIEVVEHLHYKGESFSLVKAFPRTGRTHQIRIHLSQVKHPIIGDRLYGKALEIISKRGLFLAATGLEFQHPATLKKMNFELPLPKKFREIKKLACNT